MGGGGAGRTLVVNLTDPPRQEAAARVYVDSIVQERRFATRGRCPHPPPMEFRRVDYDFNQLLHWSYRTVMLMGLEGATMRDIDEKRNRIALGFADSVGVRHAERALATLDVPREAFIIEIVPPAQLRSGTP